MRKQLFTLLCALVAGTGISSAEVYSGSCGYNLSWTLDTQDSILHITGTGKMTDFDNPNTCSYCTNSPFSNPAIAVVDVEEGVTSIGDYAFEGQNGINIRVVHLPSTIQRIGKHAFDYCPNLYDITIPDACTEIGEHAFEDCYSLTSLFVPNTVTTIGTGAFTHIPNVDYHGSASPKYNYDTNWQARTRNGVVDGYFIYTDETKATLSACSAVAIDSVMIPYGVISIAKVAFLACENITYLYIPSTVTNIGSEACFMNNNIKSRNHCCIVFDAKRCDDFTAGQPFLRYASSSSSPHPYVVLGDSVEYLPNYFYENLYHASLRIPKNLKEIGLYAIDKNISAFYVDEENAYFSSNEGFLYDKNKQILLNAGELGDDVNIPEGTIAIASRAFWYASMKSVYLPESLQEIKEYAFTEISVGKSTKIIMKTNIPPTVYSNSIDPRIPIYVPLGSLSAYQSDSQWNGYIVRVLNWTARSNGANPTSVSITIGDNYTQQYISSCGLDGSKEEYPGYIIECIGLEPANEYANVPLFIKTIAGDRDTIHYSFVTSALELTTQPSKPVSSTTAILLAQTNMVDAEVSCGFEWKRNDAPDDMPGAKVHCPVANGTMAGRLTGLKDDVYYKYRAYYLSAAGNIYFGDWQYIFTGDNTVEFDPILYTYAAVSVTETEATLRGYALAGSEDFTEQGFEYWAESRVPHANNAPAYMPAALGEHHFVKVSGISMTRTLTGLDEGTVYKYRTYAKISSQTIYGSEMSFTTKGEYSGTEDIEAITSSPDTPVRKILHGGQIFILRGDKVYSITGQEVK